MEPWQKSHIQRNLSELQLNTEYNVLLRAVLIEQNTLSENDISDLDAANNRGRLEASALLYRILLTRKGSCEALMDACEKTNQTGALHILKQARPDGPIVCFQPRHINDSTTWDMLSEDLKNEMRNKLVGFQGKNVKLSECCNGQEQHIDGKFLRELVKGNTPTLVNNQVPDPVEYYIHRTLRSRSKLKNSVFQQHCDDVFVFEGMEKYQLTNLVAGAETDVSGNQIECLTVRYILLVYEGDFESICELAESPVHLIKHRDEIFEWVKSCGSVKNLQKHVDDAQECFPEGELASRRNRINVIPDSPGMGKTLLLQNVAHQISKGEPNLLIRFIVMKDLVEAFGKVPINLDSVISLIADQSSEFECGTEIVKHILTSQPCILMFDGFDEVLLNQIATAKQILKIVVTFKLAQIFVTTRPHMREELENTLHLLGYTINPFSETDQENFLVKFWQQEGAEMNEYLKQFAKECVKSISLNMTDFERNIAGIPLQCKMLAETYTLRARRCSQQRVSTSNAQPLGQITSIFEMYKKHMKTRLEKWESQVEAIKNVHTYYALELLFREHALHYLELKSSSFSLNELCSIGLLEATNSNDIRFVHRTFAEYFVAWFATPQCSAAVTQMSENSSSFLLNELLATRSGKEHITTPFGKSHLETSHNFNYPVIAYFINGFTKLDAKNRLDHSDRVSLLMDSVYYGQVSRILIAAAISDYQFVPQTASLCFDTSELNKKGDSDVSELLLISAKHSSLTLMKIFCAQRDLASFRSQAKSDSFVLTPLHVAVQRGHYYLVAYLAGKYEPELKTLHYLIHFCIFQSLKEKEETINDKVQIIQLLSSKHSVWLDEKLPNGTVPLLQNNVNCELIKCLIERGTDVNVFDKNENSILHKITENPVTPEFYHWLVVSLHERNFKHFNHPNLRKVSPLHCAMEKVELLPDTLKYFDLNNVHFNAEDMEHESPLYYAIRGGRSVELISALIKLGALWKKTNKFRQTVLHVCAKHGHYHAMKYFLKTLKMEVNVKDKEDRTPLHYAVMKRSTEYESMQQLLITGGADVNAKTRANESCTPFRRALRDGKGLTLSIIKLMEANGLLIDASRATEAMEDLLSNSKIMSWEISKEFIPVIEFLIGKVLIGKGAQIEDVQVHKYYSKSEHVNIWKSEGVQKNMPDIIKATDIRSLWAYIQKSELLTESELENIQNLSTSSFNKCERFFEAVQTKKGSFERVCILLIRSNQISSFSLLRHSITAVKPRKMFMTLPTFTKQFLHTQQNSSVITMALVSTNPFLTIKRIRDTIGKSLVLIKEADISYNLQKTSDEDLVVVKVRVLTCALINRLEESRAAQGKIIFVCSAVSENVENIHVANDTISTWDDLSTGYLRSRLSFRVLYDDCYNIFDHFRSPLILSNLSHLRWAKKSSQLYYSVQRYMTGHIDMEYFSKSYLCPTIFHYLIPDKLVFAGISIQKLKEFARFGHKIGNFGDDDVDNFDFILIEQYYQFDEICKQTSRNVHLVEYEQEKSVFSLVKTWGWDENITRYLKKPLCEGFPYCSCAPGNKNLVVRLFIRLLYTKIPHQLEYLVPIREFSPRALSIMKLTYAEELFNIRALLKRICGHLQVEQIDLTGKSHSEQIVHLITEHLSIVLIENVLHHAAINTLFPNLAEKTNEFERFEKYQQLGMLKQIDNNRMVFVHQSLAWYFIAKLLLGLTETTEFEGLTNALRKEAFKNCFEYLDVKVVVYYYPRSLHVSTFPKLEVSSFGFQKITCFRFIDAVLKQTCERNIASFRGFLRSLISSEPEGNKWIHACVNANLFHLLQLILSFKMDALTSTFELEDTVVLAVNYADVPLTCLVIEQFEKNAKRKLTEIKIIVNEKDISLVSLAALRGHYGLVEYLLNDKEFRQNIQTSDELEKVVKYCVNDTSHSPSHEIIERKRIVDILLQNDTTFLNEIRVYSMIHVDLIVYLINLASINGEPDYRLFSLYHCPEYLTPPQYHEIVRLIHSKFHKSIPRLFHGILYNGDTAFHFALEHVELLDETIALFSEAEVNFNTLNEFRDSLFVHAAKHFKSARLLDTLHHFGANIHARCKNGWLASKYCKENQMALRYLSSRGVAIYDADDDEDRDEDNDSQEDLSSDSDCVSMFDF